MSKLVVYTINGEQYLHIQSFVDLIDRRQQSTRHLIYDGNSVRRLKATRDRSRILIPVKELIGYPFINQGKQLNGKDVYHYKPFNKENEEVLDIDKALAESDTEWRKSNIEWRRCFCELCTYTLEKCERRRDAEALVVDTSSL